MEITRIPPPMPLVRRRLARVLNTNALMALFGLVSVQFGGAILEQSKPRGVLLFSAVALIGVGIQALLYGLGIRSELLGTRITHDVPVAASDAEIEFAALENSLAAASQRFFYYKRHLSHDANELIFPILDLLPVSSAAALLRLRMVIETQANLSETRAHAVQDVLGDFDKVYQRVLLSLPTRGEGPEFLRTIELGCQILRFLLPIRSEP